jgi:hypothetical protein
MLTGSEFRPVVKTPIPGPIAQSIIEKDHRYVATTTKTSPIAGKRAKGCVVEDVDGNLLLDFTSGIGVLNLGHGHLAVQAAVRARGRGHGAYFLRPFPGESGYPPASVPLERSGQTHERKQGHREGGEIHKLVLIVLGKVQEHSHQKRAGPKTVFVRRSAVLFSPEVCCHIARFRFS